MEDPIQRFVALFEAAKANEPHDATAMTLATVDADGALSARIVLLKGVDARGFVFYTNRHSRKGQALAANPRAALAIHWPAAKQQVRVEGSVELVSDAESDAYFASRNRESQLGAWASDQSAPLASREELVARTQQLSARYPGAVPRPPHWGGYRVVPARIELWFDGAARLHDRFVYTRVDGRDGWAMQRLNP